MRTFLMVLTALLGAVSAAPVRATFVSGEQLAHHCRPEGIVGLCEGLIMGAFDGLELGFSDVNPDLPNPSFCISGRNDLSGERLRSIVLDYLAANPQRRSSGLGLVVLGAVHEAYPCPARAPALATCPARFNRSQAESLTCVCTAELTRASGPVWGTDVYTDDSSICRAAVHAGVIPPNGGQVTLRPESGRSSYAASARNGISTSAYGNWGGSFRFEPPEAANHAQGAPVQKPGSSKP